MGVEQTQILNKIVTGILLEMSHAVRWVSVKVQSKLLLKIILHTHDNIA